jgi:hypothetical protein
MLGNSALQVGTYLSCPIRGAPGGISWLKQDLNGCYDHQYVGGGGLGLTQDMNNGACEWGEEWQ